MSRNQSAGAVPVILLTGYLGAGKTSLLNHLLRHPDARIGVVVNDFGDLNIDAGLVVGQVDEPFSISGGCICCLDDDTSLEDALTALAKPRLRLDAIIVEASGFAEPLTWHGWSPAWATTAFTSAGSSMSSMPPCMPLRSIPKPHRRCGTRQRLWCLSTSSISSPSAERDHGCRCDPGAGSSAQSATARRRHQLTAVSTRR